MEGREASKLFLNSWTSPRTSGDHHPHSLEKGSQQLAAHLATMPSWLLMDWVCSAARSSSVEHLWSRQCLARMFPNLTTTCPSETTCLAQATNCSLLWNGIKVNGIGERRKKKLFLQDREGPGGHIRYILRKGQDAKFTSNQEEGIWNILHK